MIRAFLPFSAAILALSCASANSQSLPPEPAQSCQAWSAAQRAPQSTDAIASDNWVVGYFTGVAKIVNADYQIKALAPVDILRGLDKASIVSLVNRYCVGHPQKTVDEVVGELSGQMIADNPSATHPVRAQALNTTPRQAETTGSGDVTGSIRPAPAICHVFTIKDRQVAGGSGVTRTFDKCD